MTIEVGELSDSQEKDEGKKSSGPGQSGKEFFLLRLYLCILSTLGCRLIFCVCLILLNQFFF